MSLYDQPRANIESKMVTRNQHRMTKNKSRSRFDKVSRSTNYGNPVSPNAPRGSFQSLPAVPMDKMEQGQVDANGR